MGSLVKTAPGHTSLHKDDCLICHKTRAEAGAERGARPAPGAHGRRQALHVAATAIDEHAPLPESMTGRGDNCWICHNGPEFTYLFESPSPGPSGPMAPEGSAAPAPAASSGTGEVGTGASWALVRP